MPNLFNKILAYLATSIIFCYLINLILNPSTINIKLSTILIFFFIFILAWTLPLIIADFSSRSSTELKSPVLVLTLTLLATIYIYLNIYHPNLNGLDILISLIAGLTLFLLLNFLISPIQLSNK